jgi:hypothetical protein
MSNQKILTQLTLKNQRQSMKAKVSLCHTTKVYRGMEVQFHTFLISAPDADEWLISYSTLFCPKE